MTLQPVVSPRPSAAVTAAARRLVWRYLLPIRPTHAVVVGASPDLVDAARLTGLADRVTAELSPGDRPDLVAVLADAPPGWEGTAAALVPGGVLWWETDRRRPGRRRDTPTRIADRCRDLGLVPLSAHGLRPAPDRCEWYVPLHHDHAARWFVDALYAPASALQSLGEVCLRGTTGLQAERIGRVVPFHAVMAQRPWGPGAPADEDAVGELHTALTGTAVGSARAVVTHGGGRAVVLVFAHDDRRPSVVVKAPVLPGVDSDERAEHEDDVTRRVASIGAIGPTVPTPLGVHRGEPTLLAQSGAPGRSLARITVLTTRRLTQKIADLDAVAAWLHDLHLERHPGTTTWGAGGHGIVIGRLDAYAARFGLTAAEADAFGRVRRLSAALRGVAVPTVWEHGDLTVWNVLRDEGSRVHVLDWEGARPGLPLADLLRFATHWHELVQGRRHEAGRQAALRDLVAPPVTPSRETAAARAAIDRYVAELVLPSELEPILHVAGWAELAVRRDDLDRRVGHGSGGRAGNNAVAYLHAVATASSQGVAP